MPTKAQFINQAPLHFSESKVEGNYVEIRGERFYKISNYNEIRPFFMSLVSHADHWLFISSTGGLSAGRKNENSALFPYYTDDKIAESSESTGSKTIIVVEHGDRQVIWEPFSLRTEKLYTLSRNLYKNATGNKLVFEEVNNDLQLSFEYTWQFSDKYGIVKQSTVKNLGNDHTNLKLLDGLQNILPYGIGSDLQNIRSNLANAYKRSELEPETGLGIFALSSMIVDRAEPSEALKATTVWHSGVDANHILLSSFQLDAFRKGEPLLTEDDVKAEPGSYFFQVALSLKSGSAKSWYTVAEVNQDHAQVNDLIEALKTVKPEIEKDLKDDIEAGTQELRKLVGMADGLQLTADGLSVGRHYFNVLFNIMRGGIFADQYKVEKEDLLDYFQSMNKTIDLKSSFFTQLPTKLDYQSLIKRANDSEDSNIIRLCYEYLPLTFSRRHGDPSRPWNKFSIETAREDGTKIRAYAGNWRDIFQNWEALSISFPDYLLSMITKFVNASTIDGYNPYRITRKGIDWEVIEPDDPWSYIGYWGDHQIIYLLKLLELAQCYHGKELQTFLNQRNFVYANVPYRIKSYAEIVKDPQDTIDFDDNLEHLTSERVEAIGGDGKLIFENEGQMLTATLTEKLLVMFLAKMSNFIPEAGIWLNTQRPEWNDANNALVGNGTSMVTLYYLRRFVSFGLELLESHGSHEVNEAIFDLFKGISGVFEKYKELLRAPIADVKRKEIVDQLGKLGEQYRQVVYDRSELNRREISNQDVLAFFKLSLAYIDHSIKANRKKDGLYHSYNLIQFKGDELQVDHLYEMLEGQVSVLSAGLLNFEESLEVLDALKNSDIYRADQYSYMLYPNRQLPKFLEKNTIPKAFAENSHLVKRLVASEDQSVVLKDRAGSYHFNGSFNNAVNLRQALDELKKGELKELVEAEYQEFLDVFEEMFNHKAFTGRSGTFFGYEGLGSIYWHMVSKLLLAAQENLYAGAKENFGSEKWGKMVDHYYEIRAGIGMAKSPELYGSFPTEPYSHTPGHKGAQQPGMTGQVKEDVLNRFAELGVRVKKGQIVFDPLFLSDREFLSADQTFEYYDLEGESQRLLVKSGELAFTYCQVPVIYTRGDEKSISLELSNGKKEEFESNLLTGEWSGSLFGRKGQVRLIRVVV